MNKILILLVCTLLTGIWADCQSILKPVGKGLNLKISCSCTDSVGNIYAVTEPSADSIVLNRYDLQSGQWAVVSKLGRAYTNIGFTGFIQPTQSTCAYLGGKFYFTGNFWTLDQQVTEFHAVIYEYADSANGKWKKLKNKGNYAQLKSIKYDNKIYFMGFYDSIGQVLPNGIAVYDGQKFKVSGFPYSLMVNGSNTRCEISNDTLFVANGNIIYYHLAPGKWGIYYSSPNYIESLAIRNYVMYAGSGKKIFLISGGVLEDSIFIVNPNFPTLNYPYKNHELIAFRDQILVMAFGTIYSIKNLKDIKPVFNVPGIDTSGNLLFLKFRSDNLYIHSSNGMIYNGIDYNNIAEILTDSLKGSEFDTVLIEAFRDINKDYKRNVSEPRSPYGLFTLNSYPRYADQDGKLIYYPLNNENFYAGFKVEYNMDSCFKQFFSGTLSSRTYNSPRTNDTLSFPLWKTSVKNKNLILKSWGYFNERIGDITPLNIRIFNRDCDLNQSSAEIKVVLDPNTDVVSSTPAYTSKNGNTLIYHLSGISPYGDGSYIRLKVVYPYGKYTLGQKVRHYTRLTTTIVEDTMDNTDSIVQELVYSRDPNSKDCVPSGRITKELKNIRYYIHFQNEGSDDARKVIVIDTLNLKMPVYGFQMVGSSHVYSVSLKGNIVTWVFENINLKPKSRDVNGSMGYIVFDARVKGSLRTGDSIMNKAHIYFDLNDPIETKDAVVKRVGSDNDFIDYSIKHTVRVFPNPASGNLTMENLRDESQNLTIYDVKGAKVSTTFLEAFGKMIISTENWASGIYIIVNAYGKGLKLVIE